MVEITSADAAKIVDSSSRELLEEIKEKHKKWRMWPATAVLSIVVMIMANSHDWPSWSLVILGLIFASLTSLAYIKDEIRKSTVVLYNFDSRMEPMYAGLLEAASTLAGASKIWHIEASAAVYDRKYHAGAGNLVKRKGSSIRKSPPPFLKTNIETIAIDLGRKSLHLFPDRIFIFDGSSVGAVSYSDIDLAIDNTRFIESSGVPRDAEVVDRTWQYVNKKGGPDRRFKNNRELPVCKYEEISIRSSSGINELLQFSRVGGGQNLDAAIKVLAKNVSNP